MAVTMDPEDLTEQAIRLPRLLNLSQQTITRELIDAACPDPLRRAYESLRSTTFHRSARMA